MFVVVLVGRYFCRRQDDLCVLIGRGGLSVASQLLDRIGNCGNAAPPVSITMRRSSDSLLPYLKKRKEGD